MEATEFKVKKWRDSLIGCPSQCFRIIERNGIKYEIYLRWRWNDPWKAYISVIDSSERDELSVSYFKEDQVSSVKRHATKLAKQYILNLNK